MAARAPDLTGYHLDDKPASTTSVEVICQDRYGTYNPPFHCRWQEGSWLNSETGRPLELVVIGWRTPKRSPRKQFPKPKAH